MPSRTLVKGPLRWEWSPPWLPNSERIRSISRKLVIKAHFVNLKAVTCTFENDYSIDNRLRQALHADASKTFTFTGKTLNVLPILIDAGLGIGKSAPAHGPITLMSVRPNPSRVISTETHADVDYDLTSDSKRGPVFAEGQGYVNFSAENEAYLQHLEGVMVPNAIASLV
ncbi:hypothetical protein NEOLEDRAFT_1148286 [Neolentinus lepideus HHB14362 ss-1]|uniref:Uncharacterized protein n=1 Tax=Neolentinus lepideus HHB14362 ss-1 TaxID=1314782 RepID=A0A165SEF3_9AGAM|nr:hypothetical protein NEOLEDRAFT_1148286 [Neolentinus lepideus HHB14362 ss-1]